MSPRLLDRMRGHGAGVAISDGEGDHSYAALLQASERCAHALFDAAAPAARAAAAAGAGADSLADPRGDVTDLRGARVAFMVSPGRAYVATLLGIWRAGGVAVPLCLTHPAREVAYVVDDTRAAFVIADAAHAERLRPLAAARGIWLLDAADLAAGAVTDAETHGGLDSPAWNADTPASDRLPAIDAARPALILYTSGTTSRPKGVVLTHANLESQITTLVEAWEWHAADRIMHFLPLHHVHGIVNKLLCALWTGATCEMPGGFDAERVWQRVADGGLTVFMAVPTIYVKLIAAWESASAGEQARMSGACRQFRLMVSGSAALPASTFERWREIAGHALLERYGMTEIGMALSNPLHGERRPGTVGQPLPGVEVRLLDERGSDVTADGAPGEIHVRGASVFLEYWDRPDATAAAFRDGWFRTGDVAVVEGGYYRILGRSSVDIIKTGGYKVSALEIEEVLRTHPTILDCVVVGVADEEWGERVCAAIVASAAEARVDLEQLGEWLAERLAPYKQPRRWAVVAELPRNALGKVMKPEVKRLFA